MRINLTKQDLINSIYMKIGFSKKISETLLDDFFSTILENLITHKKVKITNFGTFYLKEKINMGRNPKTKEDKIISKEMLYLLKPQNLRNTQIIQMTDKGSTYKTIEVAKY